MIPLGFFCGNVLNLQRHGRQKRQYSDRSSSSADDGQKRTANAAPVRRQEDDVGAGRSTEALRHAAVHRQRRHGDLLVDGRHRAHGRRHQDAGAQVQSINQSINHHFIDITTVHS